MYGGIQFIQGNNGNQTYFATLEDQVSPDNAVRLIDAFIDKLELQKLGFTNTVHKSEGRPPYAPAVLLKLYLYGYLNKIRSRRKPTARVRVNTNQHKHILDYKRKSFIEIGEIFSGLRQLTSGKNVRPDEYKDVIINSLDYLSNAGKIGVFGFVVMPNHVHLIWRTKELNGKETAHEFRKMLHREDKKKLLSYRVDAYK
jgi:hypothetical protein